MRGGPIVAPADRNVDFRWVLGGEQVVGHGDGGQQDDDDQRQCDKLKTAVAGQFRVGAQVEPDHENGQAKPGEIERQLHEQKLFYDGEFEGRVKSVIAEGDGCRGRQLAGLAANEKLAGKQ